jgi:hypothetical protein
MHNNKVYMDERTNPGRKREREREREREGERERETAETLKKRNRVE